MPYQTGKPRHPRPDITISTRINPLSQTVTVRSDGPIPISIFLEEIAKAREIIDRFYWR